MQEHSSPRRRSTVVILSLLLIALSVIFVVFGVFLCIIGTQAAISAKIHYKATAGALSVALALFGGVTVIVGVLAFLAALYLLRYKK